MIENENNNTLVKKGYKQTKLGWIPEEWEICKLEKILKIGSGKDYKNLQSGNIPVYGTGGYMLSVNDYLYDGESVCIGRKGTIDKPQFLTGKFWTVDTLFYTHSFKNCIPRYIYNVFITVPWKLYNEASGVPSLSKRTIEKIKIKLPPLPEQRKIAQILNIWDKAIALQEQLIAEKQALKKGLMQELLTGKKRFPGFDEEWEEKLVGDITEYLGGEAFKSTDKVSDGVKWLKIANVGIGKLKWKDATTFLPENFIDLKPKYVLKKGDIVMALTRPVLDDKLKIAELKEKDGIALLNQRVAKLIPKDRNEIKFIFYLHQTSRFIYSMNAMMAGTDPPNISIKHLSKKGILIPNYREQKKIVNTLKKIDTEIENLIKYKDYLIQQKQGLMQQLLTGKTRVKI